MNIMYLFWLYQIYFKPIIVFCYFIFFLFIFKYTFIISRTNYEFADQVLMMLKGPFFIMLIINIMPYEIVFVKVKLHVDPIYIHPSAAV